MRTLRVRGRAQTYGLLVGVVAGLLVLGLTVPYAVGDRLASDTRGGITRPPTESELAAAAAASPVGDDGSGAQADGAVTGSLSSEGSKGVATAVGALGRRQPGAASGTGPAGAPTGLTATDVGVTATTIKVGVLLLDVGGVGTFGISVPGVDPAQQQAAVQAYFEEINARGGIHGRKLEGVFERFDVTSADDMRRACLVLTRDKKVFAVFAAGGYSGAATLCVTEENQTPLLSNGGAGTVDEFYARAQGRLFTVFPAANRQMANLVAELDRMGLLQGKKVGVLSTEAVDPGQLMYRHGVVPALRRFGYSVTHQAHLAADRGTASSQVPFEVNQMRTKQVDVVLLLGGTLENTQFVQTADGQGYRPKYYSTDWQNMYADATSQNMPASYEGTLVITTARTGEQRVGAPETPVATECRRIYEARTGRKLDRVNNNNEYGVTLNMCDLVIIFSAGATAAGTQLNRIALVGETEKLGEIALATFVGGLYRTDKHDLNDYIRTIRWTASCRCWMPVDAFRKSPF